MHYIYNVFKKIGPYNGPQKQRWASESPFLFSIPQLLSLAIVVAAAAALFWGALVGATPRIALCCLSSRLTDKLKMGNKPGKEESIQQERTEIMLKVEPPMDRAYLRWLMRDLERIHRFSPRNPQAIKPPPHYEEFMRLNGWLDLDMDDPDLARLFK